MAATIESLKPGMSFVNWDGAECVLLEKSSGRAIIKTPTNPRTEVSLGCELAADQSRGKRREEREGAVMAKGSLEALAKLPRSNPMKAAAKKETSAVAADKPNEKGASAMKSKPAAESAKKKTVPAKKGKGPKVEAVKKVETGIKKIAKSDAVKSVAGSANQGRKGRIFLFEWPITGIVRWMGRQKFSFEQAIKALKGMKVSPLPAESTVKGHLAHGANLKSHLDPATLTKAQGQQLEAFKK